MSSVDLNTVAQRTAVGVKESPCGVCLCVPVPGEAAQRFAVACVSEALPEHFRNPNQSLTCKLFSFPDSLGLCLVPSLFSKSRNTLPLPFSPPQAMFSLCMVESGADEVNLHGVTSLGLKQALEFAYTGQVQY